MSLRLPNFVFLFFVVITFSSFTFGSSHNATELGRKAISSFGKKVEREKGWILAGSGGSFCDPDKKILNLTFHFKGNYTLAQSRSLVIEIAENFIEYIKHDKKYLKIFDNSTFDENNLKIQVSFFIDYENLSQDKHEITLTSLAKGKLFYFYQPDPQKDYLLNEEEFETYEQAKTIVMAEQSEP